MPRSPEEPAKTRGLRSTEAHRRLAELGPNEIQRRAGTSPWLLFLGQFKGALIWLFIDATLDELLRDR